MLNIGMTELLVFAVIALLLLGPDKLPEAIRFVAKWSAKFKRTLSTIQHDIDRELRLSELREHMQTELKRVQELEAQIQRQLNALPQPERNETPLSTPTVTTQYQLIHPPISPLYVSQKRLTHLSQSTHLKVAI